MLVPTMTGFYPLHELDVSRKVRSILLCADLGELILIRDDEWSVFNCLSDDPMYQTMEEIHCQKALYQLHLGVPLL